MLSVYIYYRKLFRCLRGILVTHIFAVNASLESATDDIFHRNILLHYFTVNIIIYTLPSILSPCLFLYKSILNINQKNYFC